MKTTTLRPAAWLWGLLLALAWAAAGAEGAPRDRSQVPPVARGQKPRFEVKDRAWPERPGEADLCLWWDDRMAAVSVTVDDNYPQEHAWWFEKAEEVGFTVTWFVITRNVKSRDTGHDHWGRWAEVLRRGHDVQSHSVSHLADKTLGFEDEYGGAIGIFAENLPGHGIHALAYPNGKVGDGSREAAARHYAAARGVHSYINPANTVDYMNVHAIGSFILDATRKVKGKPDAPHWVNMRHMLERTPGFLGSWRGWYCVLIHGKGDASRYDKGFAFLKEHRDELWTGGFSAIARYGQERDTATLNVTESTAERIAFVVTDEMRDDWFDVPLTVKVRIPDDWRAPRAEQDGRTVRSRRVEHAGRAYLLVDAVPDRGAAVVRPR